MSQPARILTVLIDDDDLVHLTWKIAFDAKGRDIRAFHSLDSFLEAKSDIDLHTPIYIDVSLGNGVRGEKVAEALFAHGYKRLYLATGHDKESLEKPPWILGIIGKEPPL